VIAAFGPDNITANAPFNQQPDQRSALWFKMNQRVSGTISAVVNGVTFPARYDGDTVTVELPTTYFRKHGRYLSYVVESDEGRVTYSGPVEILVR